MKVNITDYGDANNQKFIKYVVEDLSFEQSNYLKENLNEEITVECDNLTLTMYFDERLYPFQSDKAKIRIDDFIIFTIVFNFSNKCI